MWIQKDRPGWVMPAAKTLQLLRIAKRDIRYQIARYGGNIPLQHFFEITQGDLQIGVWDEGSAREHQLTYDIVADMITALEENLWRVDDVECLVELSLLIRGRPRRVGLGLLGFIFEPATKGLNSTTLNPSTASNETGMVPLGADRWEYRVPNSETLLVINKDTNGRRMPVLKSLQLLQDLGRDIEFEADTRGGETPLVGGGYIYYYDNLDFEAHQRREAETPLTYNMVLDVVEGLKQCFWRVNYVESTVEVYRVESPRSNVNAGFATISFGDFLNRNGLNGTMQNSSTVSNGTTIASLRADRWENRVPGTETS